MEIYGPSTDIQILFVNNGTSHKLGGLPTHQSRWIVCVRAYEALAVIVRSIRNDFYIFSLNYSEGETWTFKDPLGANEACNDIFGCILYPNDFGFPNH